MSVLESDIRIGSDPTKEWQKDAREAIERGVCPWCFAKPEEDGFSHEEGCYIGQLEEEAIEQKYLINGVRRSLKEQTQLAEYYARVLASLKRRRDREDDSWDIVRTMLDMALDPKRRHELIPLLHNEEQQETERAKEGVHGK